MSPFKKEKLRTEILKLLPNNDSHIKHLINNGSTYGNTEHSPIITGKINMYFDFLAYNLLKNGNIISAISFTPCELSATVWRISGDIEYDDKTIFSDKNIDIIRKTDLIKRNELVKKISEEFADKSEFYIIYKKNGINQNIFENYKQKYKNIISKKILNENIELHCSMHWVFKWKNGFYSIYGGESHHQLHKDVSNKNNILYFMMFESKQELKNSIYDKMFTSYGIKID